MNRPLQREDLKLDATVLELENQLLVIYNANIPAYLCADENERREALIRIANLFATDFTKQCFYQVTASFTLRNKGTGEIRLWTGSFSPRGNFHAQLSAFEEFNHNTFVQTALRQTSNVASRLSWRGHDTLWTFDDLKSVIISAQCKLNRDDGLFLKRNFFPHRKRKHERISIRFEIP